MQHLVLMAKYQLVFGWQQVSGGKWSIYIIILFQNNHLWGQHLVADAFLPTQIQSSPTTIVADIDPYNPCIKFYF